MSEPVSSSARLNDIIKKNLQEVQKMGFAGIFEFAQAIFNNADIIEIVNMIMGIIGPLIGGILQ